jgi:hypothetical protein
VNRRGPMNEGAQRRMRISDPKDPESLADSLAALSDDDLMDIINSAGLAEEFRLY